MQQTNCWRNSKMLEKLSGISAGSAASMEGMDRRLFRLGSFFKLISSIYSLPRCCLTHGVLTAVCFLLNIPASAILSISTLIHNVVVNRKTKLFYNGPLTGNVCIHGEIRKSMGRFRKNNHSECRF